MKSTKTKVIAILCLAVVLMSVGYAAFSTVLTVSGTVGTSSEWKVVFTKIEQVSKTTGVTEVEVPEAEGTSATFNVDLKSPGDRIEYEITVANQGTLDAIIEDIKASETGSDAINFEISNIKIGDTLTKKSSTTFNVIISYDSNITSQPNVTTNELTIDITYVQNLGQNIEGKDPIIQGPVLLSSAILRDNQAQSDEAIDFSKTSEESGTNGLYYTSTNTENNGTTYYFRGDVDNNYVKFGNEITKSYCTYKGHVVYDWETFDPATAERCFETPVCYSFDFGNYYIGVETQEACNGEWTGEYATGNVNDIYWRIVRINEDGSIRLIYNGVSAYGSGEAVLIGLGGFQKSSVSSNSQVGYMYGSGNLNDANTEDRYKITHSNDISSNIKEYIDDWYESNLKENYESYLADAGFCNDRSVASSAGIWHANDTALGYLRKETYYGGYNRLKNLYKPQFACPNPENDLFTLKESSKGNKALDNPIGLITADEVAYAGHSRATGIIGKFYLDTGYNYWTMTPLYYRGYGAIVSDEYFGFWGVADARGIRPVINVKPSAILSNTLPSGCTSQNGTADCPYIIKTN